MVSTINGFAHTPHKDFKFNKVDEWCKIWQQQDTGEITDLKKTMQII